MDLQVQGSQSSFRGEAEAPRAEAPAFTEHLLYAQTKEVLCSHFTGEVQRELGLRGCRGASGFPVTVQIGTF